MNHPLTAATPIKRRSACAETQILVRDRILSYAQTQGDIMMTPERVLPVTGVCQRLRGFRTKQIDGMPAGPGARARTLATARIGRARNPARWAAAAVVSSVVPWVA